MVLLTIVSKIIPVILLLVLGVLMKKYHFLSEVSISELKKLVVNIALPALLFFSFLNIDFQRQYLWVVLIIFLANILMLVIGKLIQVIAGIKNNYFPLMLTGFEMGMLGFSLYGSIYGTDNLGFIGVLDLGQEIFVWFVLTSLLLALQTGSVNIRTSLKNFATSPVIIAIALGIVLNILGLKHFLTTNVFMSGLLSTVSMISQLTIPLILIIIGYQLNLHFSKFRLPMVTIVLRLFICIVFAVLIDRFFFNRLLHLPRAFTVSLFTMFILPPPFIIPLFMKKDDVAMEEYVGNTLSLGTIFTIVGFIVLVFIFGV